MSKTALTILAVTSTLVLGGVVRANAAVYTFTSDDCHISGPCGGNGTGSTNNNFGTVIVAADASNPNLLDFIVQLTPTGPLQFLGGNGAGSNINASLAFTLAPIFTPPLTFTGIVPSGNPVNPTSFTQVSNTSSTILMDTAGNFNFGLTCTPCISNIPGGTFLQFDISATGSTGADLLNALTFGTGGSFFAADVINTTTGATGVIDATPGTPSLTPIPSTLPLFATGLGALGLLGWRRKRKAQA